MFPRHNNTVTQWLWQHDQNLYSFKPNKTQVGEGVCVCYIFTVLKCCFFLGEFDCSWCFQKGSHRRKKTWQIIHSVPLRSQLIFGLYLIHTYWIHKFRQLYCIHIHQHVYWRLTKYWILFKYFRRRLHSAVLWRVLFSCLVRLAS